MRYPVMRLKSRGRGWGRAEPQFSASVWSSDSISQFKQAPPLNILTFLKYKLGGSEVMSICCINMLTSAWLVLLLWSLECKLENQQLLRRRDVREETHIQPRAHWHRSSRLFLKHGGSTKSHPLTQQLSPCVQPFISSLPCFLQPCPAQPCFLSGSACA